MNSLADLLSYVVTALQRSGRCSAVRVLDTQSFSARQYAIKVRAELREGGLGGSRQACIPTGVTTAIPNSQPAAGGLLAAGWLARGKRWLPSRASFLLPVEALSVLFRAKFRDALRQTALFEQVAAEVWSQGWVVHCQPVGDGTTALKYLAPYVFRVAISNRRILKLEHALVTFTYKAGKSGQQKTCTVSAEEFIRRFLQHVLPKGFCKVRYYGFFSAGQRPTLQRVRQVLGVPVAAPEPEQETSDTQLRRPDMRCPTCNQVMYRVSRLQPSKRDPPR